jgi:hypothetical protein
MTNKNKKGEVSPSLRSCALRSPLCGARPRNAPSSHLPWRRSLGGFRNERAPAPPPGARPPAVEAKRVWRSVKTWRLPLRGRTHAQPRSLLRFAPKISKVPCAQCHSGTFLPCKLQKQPINHGSCIPKWSKNPHRESKIRPRPDAKQGVVRAAGGKGGFRGLAPRVTLINLTLIRVTLCICSFHCANTALK